MNKIHVGVVSSNPELDFPMKEVLVENDFKNIYSAMNVHLRTCYRGSGQKPEEFMYRLRLFVNVDEDVNESYIFMQDTLVMIDDAYFTELLEHIDDVNQNEGKMVPLNWIQTMVGALASVDFGWNGNDTEFLDTLMYHIYDDFYGADDVMSSFDESDKDSAIEHSVKVGMALVIQAFLTNEEFSSFANRFIAYHVPEKLFPASMFIYSDEFFEEMAKKLELDDQTNPDDFAQLHLEDNEGYDDLTEFMLHFFEDIFCADKEEVTEAFDSMKWRYL